MVIEIEGNIPQTTPISITADEFQLLWKPAGWNLLIIGPTSTWRQEWGEWEAIRDIVQNCLDETESYESGFDREGLWIADQGKGVAVADFLLGPPRLKADYARGKYGEGMKIAALSMIRSGFPTHIDTFDKEAWMVFLEQETGNHMKAKSLSALWRPQPDKYFRWGTKFHFIGYNGPDYKWRFAVNIPREATLVWAPTTLESPLKRYNQLIEFAFPDDVGGGTLSVGEKDSRIFARDIYMRSINSVFSYNLWGFDLAPDRYAPKSEEDLWMDMGRTWAYCDNPRLLDIFFQMVKLPAILHTDESNSLAMDNYRLGRPAGQDKSYLDTMRDNAHLWYAAFKRQYGEGAVLRTSERWDNIVKHLGYTPVSVSWAVESAIGQVVLTDSQLIDQSQERLREVEITPDNQLTDIQMASLELARAIARKRAGGVKTLGVHAALIPPASDRARTAGMYSTITKEIYINLDQLEHGRRTIDTVIHELAHHRSRAEDLEEGHARDMTNLAGQVVEDTAKGIYDEYLRNLSFIW